MFLNNCPQKTKNFYSHKYFHGNSCFAALCCEVVFLHIQKNLLGHFSKMDKENECPKSKNATLSLFTVFYVGRKKWEQTVGFLRKVGTICGILWMGEDWEFIYPQIWYINNIIISAQTILLPMS